jgi:putative PEP-CTERM system histidine kinase
MLTDIALLSYMISALAFISLGIALVTIWRARLHSMALAIVCLLNVIWSLAVVVYIQLRLGQVFWITLFEIFRSASWIIFLLRLYRPENVTESLLRGRHFVHIKSYVPGIFIFFVFQFFALILSQFKVDVGHFWIGILELIGGSGGGIITSVIGLLLIEQFFRGVSAKVRWGIKFACLGIGGLFAYDFYLYSDAMLFKKINVDIWTARGFVNALMVPLIAISVSRDAKWSKGILVSRKLLFQSVTLVGAAIYLLAMAAAGYYLRFFGGSWGIAVQVAFLFGALILLLILLFSGSVRSWLKVFISKHFYHYNYDYREVWIRLMQTLTTHDGDLRERSIQALAELVESPAGALYLNAESNEFLVASQWNMPVSNCSEASTSAFCRLLEDKQWIVDLQDIETQASIYKDIQMPHWLRDYPRAWLIIPLMLHGKLFGFVILAQARSKLKLNWEILDLLKIAGSQVAGYLAQEEASKALLIARQFDSFNRMSTFMVHDLKNLVAQLSLLLANAEKHQSNPAFQKDMLDTIDHSVQKMKALLQKLSRGASVEAPSLIEMSQLLKDAVNSKSPYEPKPKLNIIHSDIKVQANRQRLERVIGHIIQNAIDATPSNGDVFVILKKEGNFAVIEVQDTGSGMSEEFVKEKLFSPFVSTKVAGMGIGVFETREYLRELGGRLDVTSRLDIGSIFKMTLPIQG